MFVLIYYYIIYNIYLIITSVYSEELLNILKGSKFYIYDDEEWRKMGTFTLRPRDKTERMQNVLNAGAGIESERTEGVFHTNQYQLYNNVYFRALRDPRRTRDATEAQVFLIPYDLASDAAKYVGCPKNTSKTCYDFNKCILSPKVETLLNNSPYFHKNFGRDHILLVGVNYAMHHYLGKPLCKKFLSGICRNCTKFCIDDYSYYWASTRGIEIQGDNWHAVPFPSDFHFNKNLIRPFPWENTNRPYIASYVGSLFSYSNGATKLKSAIGYYCALHNTTCIHSNYGSTETNARDTEYNAAHRPYLAYRQSIFCFQPVGDLPTRKGLFDGLLQGCIPVVFDIQTAENMYTWHWEQTFWEAVVIRLNMKETGERRFDPMIYLENYVINNYTNILYKQQLIRSRVFELQYSLDGPYEVPPIKNMLINNKYNEIEYNNKIFSSHFNNSKHFHNNTWPLCGNHLNISDLRPCRDAYDIIIELSLGFQSKTIIDKRIGSVLACWDGKLNTTLNKCVL